MFLSELNFPKIKSSIEQNIPTEPSTFTAENCNGVPQLSCPIRLSGRKGAAPRVNFPFQISRRKSGAAGNGLPSEHRVYALPFTVRSSSLSPYWFLIPVADINTTIWFWGCDLLLTCFAWQQRRCEWWKNFYPSGSGLSLLALLTLFYNISTSLKWAYLLVVWSLQVLSVFFRRIFQ